MSPEIIGYIGIGVLLLLLFTRMSIGIVMALVGFVGFAVVKGSIAPALGLVKSVPGETFIQYNLTVIPLFMLMGAFASEAGLSQNLYEGIHGFLGRLRGGLAMASVLACACFAAICGSSVATAAAMAQVSLPEMRKFKYDPGLSAGALAAGGTIGILIPPSTILIIYGIITEQSIGKLFLAGFLPGIVQALFYIVTIAIMVKINPNLGPRGDSASFKTRLVALSRTWEVLFLFIVVIGGLYIGIFTPTEAAGFGAFGAFFFGVVKRKLTWRKFCSGLADTTKSTGMIFLILMGAMILGYFITITRLPFAIAAYAGETAANKYFILVLILVILMLLGCVMDSMAIVLLTVPIFFPVIMQLQFDPIWFGILVTRVTELGLITPPVGMNIYIIKGVSGYPMGTVFRGVVPFIVADVLHVTLLVSIPQISLVLPNMMQ